MKTLGQRMIVDLLSCPSELLEKVPFIKQSMELAALEGSAHIVESLFHQFSPYGVSGGLIVQESHIMIHTWPEYGFASVDIFTCGAEMNINKVVTSLVNSLRPETIKTSDISCPL